MTLAALLARAEAVLIDFDGPICQVFAELHPHAVAERMLTELTAMGHTGERDPLELLRQAARVLDEAQLRHLDEVLRDAEVEAATTAAPTDGADDLLRACRTVGKRVAIVSNNSEPAIRTYLERHHLTDLVECVAGRPLAAPHLLKPHPHLLAVALRALGARPTGAVFIGDSVTDAAAATESGTPFIAYINKAHKRKPLTEGNPDAWVGSLRSIVDALGAGLT